MRDLSEVANFNMEFFNRQWPQKLTVIHRDEREPCQVVEVSGGYFQKSSVVNDTLKMNMQGLPSLNVEILPSRRGPQ